MERESEREGKKLDHERKTSEKGIIRIQITSCVFTERERLKELSKKKNFNLIFCFFSSHTFIYAFFSLHSCHQDSSHGILLLEGLKGYLGGNV